MAHDESAPSWRNFAGWGAAGAIAYVLAISGGITLLHEEGMGAVLRSPELAGILGLGLLFSMTWVGIGRRKLPLGRKTLRNFLVADVVAIAALLLFLWSFSALDRAGALDAMGTSEWAAVVVGSALVILALLGLLAMASAHTGAGLIDEEAANDMRERGRLHLYSMIWMAACGLLLILLTLSGPGGVLPPPAVLASALILVALLFGLGVATWRLSDELGRTLSYETANIALYLILLLAGGWAMLAHLGFMAAPEPLDWLTMFTVFLFAAAFIAVGRRKLLTP